MPVTQPISGTKVGDVGSIGTAQVVNQYQGVLPSGRPSSFAFGTQLAVYDPASRPEVQLILSEARTPSTNFDFGGGLAIYSHAYVASDVWGKTSVSNAAKDIRTTGFNHSSTSSVTVAYTPVYAKWVLDLVDPKNTHNNFYWGNPQVITAHGKTTANKFGDVISELPLPIWAQGFVSSAGVLPQVNAAVVLAYDTRATFNLILADERGTGTNFAFGAPLKMQVRGWADTTFGGTNVGNAAKDIRPIAISYSFVQPPVVSPLKKGGDINFYFDQGRGTLNAANIGFYFAGGKQIDSGGWLSQEFGEQVVYLKRQYVTATGIAHTNGFGEAVFDHFALKIRPASIVSTAAFGTPVLPKVLKTYGWDSNIIQNFTKVENWFRYVTTYPFTGQPITPPPPTIYNLLQIVRPNAKPHSNAFGTVALTNFHRFITATGWQDPDWYGLPWVTYHTRSIGPAYLTGTQTSFGTPFAALGARDIRPTAIVATLWGTSVVKDRAQQITPVGRASTLQSGTPLVRDRAQRFYPFGADSVIVGYPQVNLYRRYLNVQSITQWPVDKDRFGYYNEVRNINRFMQANGFVHALYGSNAFVLNKARPIYPYGEIQTRWGTQHVDHRIRYVLPEWYGAEVFGTPYARTNKVISLDGWSWSSMAFGVTGRVWSNLQTIQPYSTYEQTGYGTPWVDQGARELKPSAILTQPAGDPFVAFGLRRLYPNAIPHGHIGVHQLETHQNIIGCWGYPMGFIGGAEAVRNVTPEIKVFGALTYVGGNKPRVELMKRYIHNPATQNHGFMQAPFVSYRTRTIRPPSPDYLRWGGADVHFDQSQQTPPQQLILPDSVQAGAGVVPTWEWPNSDAPWSGATIPLGVPWAKLNTIFAGSLGLIEHFGVPSTKGNVLFVPPGPYGNVFGTPFLAGGTKWVRTTGWRSSVDIVNTHNVIGPQYVRLDAKWDAGSSTWYVWNYHLQGVPNALAWQWYPHTAGETFGAGTLVQNQHRSIYAHGGFGPYLAPSSVVATPKISTNPQYVRPEGYKGYKRGMPDVSIMGDKVITAYAWQDASWGTTILNKQDYGPKWMYVGGIAAPNFTMGRVELKNRRVHPTGIYQFTSPKGAQYVGPYLRLYPQGFDAKSFGTLYIDYKHRKVYPLDVRDDSEASYGPRVKHAPRGYFIQGTKFGGFGRPSMSTGIQTVAANGWEEFETGFSFVPMYYPGLSKLRTQNFITRESIIFTEMGNAHVTNS